MSDRHRAKPQTTAASADAGQALQSRITCTIFRKADASQLLAALARGNALAITFATSLRDWISHALAYRPQCLACDVTFSPGQLPLDWVLLTLDPAREAALLSGICDQCSRKTDRELQDVVLNELRCGLMPNATRLNVVENGHA
jgi:hypothetical protein